MLKKSGDLLRCIEPENGVQILFLLCGLTTVSMAALSGPHRIYFILSLTWSHILWFLDNVLEIDSSAPTSELRRTIIERVALPMSSRNLIQSNSFPPHSP